MMPDADANVQSRLEPRLLLGAGDAGDETGDVALDLVRWQVVAGASVWLAEIAADDEGAQS